MNRIRTSAPAQASAWSRGHRPESGARRSRAEPSSEAGPDSSGFPWPTSEQTRSSGAVSPAMRATASVAPVRIPPIACGRTIPSVVRQRGDPRPSAASRSEFGTSASTSIVERATSGSMITASARPPAIPALAVPDHDQAVDEDPDDDRRDAVEDVEHEADAVPDALSGELVHVDRDEDPERKRDRGRDADDDERADEGIRETQLLAAGTELADGLRLREQIEAQLDSRLSARPTRRRCRGRDAERGCEPGEQLHAAVDHTTPAQPVVRAPQHAQIGRAHPTDPRCRALRRTMNCATRFTTIERTSRMSAEIEERGLSRAPRPRTELPGDHARRASGRAGRCSC